VIKLKEEDDGRFSTSLAERLSRRLFGWDDVSELTQLHFLMKFTNQNS
jgi:hypothetical protein